jgi:hypothetical protein
MLDTNKSVRDSRGLQGLQLRDPRSQAKVATGRRGVSDHNRATLAAASERRQREAPATDQVTGAFAYNDLEPEVPFV